MSLGPDQVQSPPLPMLTSALSYMDTPATIVDGVLGAESLPCMGPSPIPSPSLQAFETGPDNHAQEEKISILEATLSRDKKEESDAPTNVTEKDAEETPVASAPSIPLSPPEAFFVPVNVHLEDPETRTLRMRKAYHMSVGPIRKRVSVANCLTLSRS